MNLLEQMDLDAPELQGNIQSWIASIREVAECQDDWTKMNRWPDIRAAHETMEGAIPRIRQWLENERLGGHRLKYSLEENSDQIPELVSMLRDGLPPAETGKGADRQRAGFRTILHAAWLHKLSRGAGFPVDPSDQNMADRLTLKAIECSHTQELFERRRKAEAKQ